MKHLLAFSLWLLCPSLSLSGATQSKDRLEELKSAAATFCNELRRERISGLPSTTQMERLAPLMTAELGAIIEFARVEQDRQMRTHPDEKPDWIEGDLFSSLFEGVSKWTIREAVSPKGADATVSLRLTYSEAGQDAVEWTDTLVLKNRSGKWLVDDIRMGGDWDFHSGETLRGRLPGGAKEGDDHLSPDERWQVTFAREGDEVVAISIAPVAMPDKSQVLFGDEGGAGCPFPTWVIWSPDGSMLAIRLGEGPRDARTLVFRLANGAWLPVELPELFAAERQALENKGYVERDHLVDAEHWQDGQTLLVHYFGNFTKNDEADGFDHFVSIRIPVQGQAMVVETVALPESP